MPPLKLAAALAAALPVLGARAASAAAETSAKAAEEEFQPEVRAPSLTFGTGSRHGLVWAELGWLKSGVGITLALSEQLDLGLRATAFLLHGGFAEQNDVHAFLRWAPAVDAFRGAVAIETGVVGYGGTGPPGSSFSVRAELAAGLALEGIATPYVRGALRLLDYHAPDHNGFTHDEELGAGVERTMGRVVVGAEVFVWARPGLSGLAQWRVRGGWAY